MLAALITTLFFALSAICANRTTKSLGGIQANFYRLVVATFLLGIWAHGFGQGLWGRSTGFFMISGLVGFGLGDLALYQAYPRLGPRLTILLNQCLATPFAALVEWLWLGTTISWLQAALGFCILAGVALALAPTHKEPRGPGYGLGIVCGVMAAMGQAGGAVISRKAYAVAQRAGEQVDGGTAAYERIIAGLVVGAIVFLAFKIFGARWNHTPKPVADAKNSIPWIWIFCNSLAGPVLGVACYQWALSTTPTAIVLPIVATTPLVIIPFTHLFEGERPGLRSILGGIIAVAAAIGLCLAR
jgi:drug/metabolite transporter (DMT)-like permease